MSHQPRLTGRLLGAAAVLGGLAWLLKVALIWANGGTNTTDGVIGVLFLVGGGALAAAAVGWAWHAPRSGRTAVRVATAVAALVGLVAAVDVPILLSRPLLADSWMAEEVGVAITAVVALWLGLRGLRRPHSSAFARSPLDAPRW